MVCSERTEEDGQFIELILCLIKNLLAIPDKPLIASSITEEQKAHLQDQFISILSKVNSKYQIFPDLSFFFISESHKENALEMLLVLSQAVNKEENRNFAFLIGELICLLLIRENPQQLIQIAVEEEREKENRKQGRQGKLTEMLQQEKQRKLGASPVRSQIRGAFVSSNPIGRNLVFKNLNINLGSDKAPQIQTAAKPVIKYIGRKPVELKTTNVNRSSIETKLILKEWVSRFLASGSCCGKNEQTDQQNLEILTSFY